MIDYARYLPTFTRIIRRLRGRCVVCGNDSRGHHGRYWYCTMTCAMWDGTMSARATPGRVLPKPSIWRGRTERWWPKEEKYI